MTSIWETLPHILAIGLLATLPLLLGVIFGAIASRRGWLGQGVVFGVDPTQKVMHGLYEWTNSVVGDIDECREKMAALCDTLDAPADEPSDQLSVAKIVGKVLQANDQMQQRLSSAESSLDRQAQQINEYLNQARTDALTGLPNRRAFDEEIAARNAQWRRYDVRYSLLMIDIDYFKRINDTYGHQAGDRILKGVARRLDHVIRETDVVARYGGEEFAVLLSVTSGAEARVAVQRLRTAVEEAGFAFEGEEIKVTISCGLADALPNEEVNSVIRRADKALYAAKEGGRNCGFQHDGRNCLRISEQGELSTAGELQQQPASDPRQGEIPAACDLLRERLLEVLAD